MVVNTFTKLEPVFGGKVLELKIHLNQDAIVGYMKNSSDEHSIVFLTDRSRFKVKESISEIEKIISRV